MARTRIVRIAIVAVTVVAALGAAGLPVAAEPQSAPTLPGSLVPTVLPPVVPASFDGDVRALPRPRQIPGVQRPELEAPATGLSTAAGPDGALQGGGIAVPAPSPTANFAGLDKATWGDGYPPDTNGDVGPNHYIQAVNTSIGIFSKSGSPLAAFTFDTLFLGTGTPCDASNGGDPVVLYDPLANRWIISDLGFTSLSGPFYQCFAVSKTADPVSGGWWLYGLQTDPSQIPDYPKLGVWPDGIYMSANMFSYNPNNGRFAFKNVRVWAFDRTDMFGGAPLSSVRFDLPGKVGGVSVFSLLPSNLRGDAPPAGRENLFSSIWGVYAVRVWKFHVDWGAPASSTFTGPWQVPVTTFSVGPSTVPEQGGNNLDTLTYRVMMQAQYRNLGGQESIWLAHTVGNGSGIASIRWYQLNVTGGTVQTSGPVQQGTWSGPDSNHRFMPSLAVDGSGDMAVGYSVSGSGIKPAIRYAGRLYTDPLGTLGQGEQTLINGAGAQTNVCGGSTCTRWGDYTAMTVDPGDDCTFWYTNEYYSANGDNWLTRIGSFKFPSCTGSPPSTTTTSSTTTSPTTSSTTTTTTSSSTTTTTTTTSSSTTTTTTTTTTPPSYSSTILGTSGLVSYWRLGETSGTTAFDSDVTPNNGTYVSAPTLGVSGALANDTNTAVTFNGSSQYVRAGSMSLGTRVSIEAWVRTSSWGADKGIAGEWAFGSGSMLYVHESGQLRFYVQGGWTSASWPSTGTWHHIVGTYDGSSGRLYVDGVLVAGPTSLSGLTTPAGYFEIATYGNAAGGKFGGTIDEVAIYNRALTSTEVLQHYNVGRGL